MADYRFESVQTDLDELEGKYRETISSWSGVIDPTYGSCYRATIAHSLDAVNSSHNVTFWDTSTNEQIFPLACRIVDASSFYVFMPVNTVTVQVVAN
jgi:hypothetical protein